MLLAGAILALSACDDDNSTNPVARSIALSLEEPTVTAAQGENATEAITLTRAGGFAGAVELSLEGAPEGLTASFDPATVAVGATSSTLTLAAEGGTVTLAVGASVAPGTYTVTVTGTGTGVGERTATVALTVTAAG